VDVNGALQPVLDETAVFTCAGDRLVGILSPGSAGTGVLLVVGGPQYRVGSHRQFVELARALSRSGVPVLRFDYRGMGDSEGVLRGFEFIGEDIRAAIDEFHRRVPDLSRVVLWGLCDGASAAALYAPSDARVAGVVMVNPWVRSEQSEASAYLRHYYLRRLLSREFWTKLLSGGVNLRASLKSFAHKVKRAFLPGDDVVPADAQVAPSPDAVRRPPMTLPDLAPRMCHALQEFQGEVLIITSGDDLTAAEFLTVSGASRDWQTLRKRAAVQQHHLDAADHTLSTSPWKRQVEAWTLEWLRSMSS
jgi:exosortase A-associated hydrolase 1